MPKFGNRCLNSSLVMTMDLANPVEAMKFRMEQVP
jgi:hypothetical protein